MTSTTSTSTRSSPRSPTTPPSTRPRTASGRRPGALPRSSSRSRASSGPGRASPARFAYDSGFAYWGALAEAEVAGPALVVGVLGRGARSNAARATPPEIAEPSDFASRQTELSGGVFGLGRWRSVRAEAWWTRSRVTDRQWGTAFAGSTIGGPYDIDERWTWRRLRLTWVPGRERGPSLGLEYLAALRGFPVDGDLQELRENVLYQLRNARHHRLSAQVGYRFSPRARITLGASYDVDRDPAPFNFRIPPVYDGAYMRLQASW